MLCHLFPYFSNALHNRSSSSAVQGSLPARIMNQYTRRERKVALTDGRIDGLLVAFCTLVIGSPRECSGHLVPPFPILCDGLEECGVLIRGPTTCMEYKEGGHEM